VTAEALAAFIEEVRTLSAQYGIPYLYVLGGVDADGVRLVRFAWLVPPDPANAHGSAEHSDCESHDARPLDGVQPRAEDGSTVTRPAPLVRERHEPTRAPSYAKILPSEADGGDVTVVDLGDDDNAWEFDTREEAEHFAIVYDGAVAHHASRARAEGFRAGVEAARAEGARAPRRTRGA
jgi:hypothetical protein